MSDLLTMRQVAEELNTSVRGVRQHFKEGLPYYDLIGGIKVSKADLDNYKRRWRGKPQPALTKEQIIADAKPVFAKPCVYFLIAGGEIVYVGKSNAGVLKRIGRHLQDKVFDSFTCIACEDREDLAWLEMSYINKFKPKYNVMGVIEELPPE